MLSKFLWERYHAGLGDEGISIALLIQSVDPRPYENWDGVMGLLDSGIRDDARRRRWEGYMRFFGVVELWGLSESRIQRIMRIARIGRDGGR